MRKWIWVVVAAVAAIAVVAYMRHGSPPPPAASDASPSVQLATVRYGEYAVVLDESGHVGAPAGSASQLAFPSAGVLRSVYVHVGERITAGQPLAALDTQPLALAAAQAAADAQAAGAQASAAAVDRFSTKLAVDRAAVARAQRLYRAGVSAQKDVEAANAQLAADEADARTATADRAAASAQAQSADAKARIANVDLSRATLTSPQSGVVTAVLRRPGESVDPSTPVIAVGSPQQAEATLQVPSADAAQIARGDAVDVRVNGGAISRGRVTAVVPSVDPATQAATVVVSGVPPDAVAGSALQAKITVSRVHGLLVPQSAIVADPQSGDDVVFVQERQKDGSMKFAQKTVSVSHEDGTTAEVASGLSPGQKIAAQGAFELLAPAGGGD